MIQEIWRGMQRLRVLLAHLYLPKHFIHTVVSEAVHNHVVLLFHVIAVQFAFVSVRDCWISWN